MHTSQLQSLLPFLTLPLALAAPPPVQPLTSVADLRLSTTPNEPFRYGIYLDTNVSNPPKYWQGDCRGVGDYLCAELEKPDFKTGIWYWKGGKDNTCQAGLFWPRDSVLKLPNRGECLQYILGPLAEPLNGAQQGETRASVNILKGGFPTEQSTGKSVDPRWPSFIVQA